MCVADQSVDFVALFKNRSRKRHGVDRHLDQIFCRNILRSLLCVVMSRGSHCRKWRGRTCNSLVSRDFHPRLFDEQFGSAVGAIDYVRGGGN